MPINITSFGEAENDISVLTKGLLKWFHIRNDPKWAPVVYGINGVLNKDNFGNTARYVALVSEIETLLNHLGKKPENLDTLIDNYATQKWKDELTKVLTNLENDSLGLFLQEIRVVITHPKAASKCNGKYWNVARDQILLQKVYAYLAGLFIKAFLQELNSICYQNIEKYVDQFIELRASWHKIEYT